MQFEEMEELIMQLGRHEIEIENLDQVIYYLHHGVIREDLCSKDIQHG